MALSNNIPTDSVLRRHYLAERGRQLGLPPTDSVLRRHHAQWQAVCDAAAAAPAVRPAATTMAAAKAAAASVAQNVASSVTQATSQATAQPVRPAAPARPTHSAPAREPEMAHAGGHDARPSGGGFFGWLRRLLGN